VRVCVRGDSASEGAWGVRACVVTLHASGRGDPQAGGRGDLQAGGHADLQAGGRADLQVGGREDLQVGGREDPACERGWGPCMRAGVRTLQASGHRDTVGTDTGVRGSGEPDEVGGPRASKHSASKNG
jgi:hypothetical protein